MNRKLNWYFDSAKIVETKVLRPSLISAAEASGDGCRISFITENPIAQENTENSVFEIWALVDVPYVTQCEVHTYPSDK